MSAHGLELVDVVDSGGLLPVSLTTYKDWLYVLNAGGSGNISGFRIGQDGTLTPLAGSTQPVSNEGVGPAPGLTQVAFNSDGSALVVTEKTTSLIDTYEVLDGLAGAPVAHPSEGAVPFGFAFDRQNHAIVSEASGSASSYEIDGTGFNVISSAVVNTQVAACWIAISKNGKFAYTTNAGSGSISSYGIGQDGSLTLLEYTLGAGSHTITVFQFAANGSLTNLGNISVPAGVAGLAAH